MAIKSNFFSSRDNPINIAFQSAHKFPKENYIKSSFYICVRFLLESCIKICLINKTNKIETLTSTKASKFQHTKTVNPGLI